MLCWVNKCCWGCHQCCLEISVIREKQIIKSLSAASSSFIVSSRMCAPLTALQAALAGGDLWFVLLPAPLTSVGMIVMGVCNCPPETLLCNYGSGPAGLNESVMSSVIIAVVPDIRNPIWTCPLDEMPTLLWMFSHLSRVQHTASGPDGDFVAKRALVVLWWVSVWDQSGFSPMKVHHTLRAARNLPEMAWE